jgi:hypothetical protein
VRSAKHGRTEDATDRERENVEALRRIYDFDWAGVGTRSGGFERLRAFVSDDFRSRMSDELGGRTVGIDALAVFVEALEQDFSEFHYLGEEYLPAGDDRVVVAGRITCVGRASKVPLSQEFGHVWTLDGKHATRMEAHMSRADALRAAGLA